MQPSGRCSRRHERNRIGVRGRWQLNRHNLSLGIDRHQFNLFDVNRHQLNAGDRRRDSVARGVHDIRQVVDVMNRDAVGIGIRAGRRDPGAQCRNLRDAKVAGKRAVKRHGVSGNSVDCELLARRVIVRDLDRISDRESRCIRHCHLSRAAQGVCLEHGSQAFGIDADVDQTVRLRRMIQRCIVGSGSQLHEQMQLVREFEVFRIVELRLRGCRSIDYPRPRRGTDFVDVRVVHDPTGNQQRCHKSGVPDRLQIGEVDRLHVCAVAVLQHPCLRIVSAVLEHAGKQQIRSGDSQRIIPADSTVVVHRRIAAEQPDRGVDRDEVVAQPAGDGDVVDFSVLAVELDRIVAGSRRHNVVLIAAGLARDDNHVVGPAGRERGDIEGSHRNRQLGRKRIDDQRVDAGTTVEVDRCDVLVFLRALVRRDFDREQLRDFGGCAVGSRSRSVRPAGHGEYSRSGVYGSDVKLLGVNLDREGDARGESSNAVQRQGRSRVVNVG